jgi:hypothetical protein
VSLGSVPVCAAKAGALIVKAPKVRAANARRQDKPVIEHSETDEVKRQPASLLLAQVAG